MTIVAVNGHFDPRHVGHIKFIQKARKRGQLIVVLNNDQTTLQKNGYVSTPQDDRKYILENIKGVSRVITVPDNDNNVFAVEKILERVQCDIFQAGVGDSKELKPVCKRLGIRFISLRKRCKDSKGEICSSRGLVKRWAGHDNH